MRKFKKDQTLGLGTAYSFLTNYIDESFREWFHDSIMDFNNKSISSADPVMSEGKIYINSVHVYFDERDTGVEELITDYGHNFGRVVNSHLTEIATRIFFEELALDPEDDSSFYSTVLIKTLIKKMLETKQYELEFTLLPMEWERRDGWSPASVNFYLVETKNRDKEPRKKKGGVR